MDALERRARMRDTMRIRHSPSIRLSDTLHIEHQKLYKQHLHIYEWMAGTQARVLEKIVALLMRPSRPWWARLFGA